jgi:hypothetical protein
MGATMTNTKGVIISYNCYFIKEEIRLKMKKETSKGY